MYACRYGERVVRFRPGATSKRLVASGNMSLEPSTAILWASYHGRNAWDESALRRVTYSTQLGVLGCAVVLWGWVFPGLEPPARA